ncbi:MAG: DUF6519 domain-containing protein, partial [Prochloraceae cyanobacterium]|nr:DUF6519 domain-containing protein [Prochloraceae cyanobacterium]
MKGDFTRLTFDSKKHYNSVRMQQGRLQLDSDWNEQVDIQNYLRRAQILASIGSDSGVPSYNPKTKKPRTDSFELKIIPRDQKQIGEDLQIAPGHLYIGGTLCELELGTPFTAIIKEPDGENIKVEVSSLVVDGRKFEEYQWLEVVPESQDKIYQIKQKGVDLEKRLLTLTDFSKSTTDKATDQQTEQNLGTIKLRRLLTYKTQPDYPNPEENLPQGNYFAFAYIDVWERNITTIEDPSIREIALNIPDTTTRSKTVWQLKLLKITEEAGKQLPDFVNAIEVAENQQEAKNTLIDDLKKFTDRQQKIPNLQSKSFKDDFNKLTTSDEQKHEFEQLLTRYNTIVDESISQDEFISQSDKVWEKFLNNNQTRFAEVKMNACAGLCTNVGASTSSTNGYQRLENQLYRVEIHDRGRIGTAKLTTEPSATFKWSRENGSIVSSIVRIEGNTIVIPKSSQDAWSSSKPGQQWIEINNEERELKGKPGVLAPLTRIISDTKIEFGSLTTNLPKKVTKVRRWEGAAIEIKSEEWIELEGGIKVKFSSDLYYETGDYWLIPARTATNDIQWPDDGGKPAKPIPQAPRGIKHDYSLLGLVNIVKINDQLKFEGFEQEEQQQNGEDDRQNKNQKKPLDRRTIFPSLQNSFDKQNGGTIKGDVNIGTSDRTANLKVAGKVGIGIEKINSRLHAKGAGFIEGTEKITSDGTQVTRSTTKTELHPGDLLKAENQTKIITQVNSDQRSLTIDSEFSSNLVDSSFDYQQPIARLEDSTDNTQFVVLGNGNTGIGTAHPVNKLDVAGAVAIGKQYAGNLSVPENGLLVQGQVGIGNFTLQSMPEAILELNSS